MNMNTAQLQGFCTAVRRDIINMTANAGSGHPGGSLSAVELAGIEHTPQWGAVLRLRGADLVDGTPVLDIKPYLPYADCISGALGGFAAAPAGEALEVVIPAALLGRFPADRREALRAVLAQDPRPHYQEDPERVYGFGFAGMEVRFSVADGVLTVREILEDRR